MAQFVTSSPKRTHTLARARQTVTVLRIQADRFGRRRAISLLAACLAIVGGLFSAIDALVDDPLIAGMICALMVVILAPLVATHPAGGEQR